MNDYHILFHQPEIGYVIQFIQTRRVQMGYSILKIEFFEDEFAVFRRCLHFLAEKNMTASSITLKNIFIPTPDPAMEIALSLRELMELRSMVEMADAEMQAMVMINALNG